MTYYKDQMIAFSDLDKSLDTSFKRKIDLDIKHLVYEFLKEHPVSEKSLRKRIEQFAEQNKIKIIGDILKVEACNTMLKDSE